MWKIQLTRLPTEVHTIEEVTITKNFWMNTIEFQEK